MSQRILTAPKNSENGVFVGGQFFPVVNGQITISDTYSAALFAAAGFVPAISVKMPQERATITPDAKKTDF